MGGRAYAEQDAEATPAHTHAHAFAGAATRTANRRAASRILQLADGHEASSDEALPALRRLHGCILDGAMAEYDGFREATRLDEEHPVVAWLGADAARSADRLSRGWAWMRGQSVAPSAGPSEQAGWARLFELLNELDGAIGARDVDRATELLVAVARRYHREHVRLQALLGRQREGAGAAVAVLEGVVGLCVLIESAGVGGLAAAGSAGLLKIATMSAVTAGVARAAFRGAQLGAERSMGLDDHHFLDVLREAGAEALTTFVGSLVGGKLSSFFLSRCGRYLGKTIDDAFLAQLGKLMRLPGPLPRDWFVGNGQRALIGFFSGVGAVPFATVVRAVYLRVLGGEKLTTAQLLDHVVTETAHAGLFQLFLGACFHLYASAPAGSLAHAEPVAGMSQHGADFGALLDGGGLQASREHLTTLLGQARRDPEVAPIIAHIADEQVMAMIGYTGADYRVINLALRMGDHRLLARLAPYIELTKQGLAGMPVYTGACLRGIRQLSAKDLARYKVGAVVEEAPFTSSSMVEGAQFDGKVSMTILSSSARKIESISQHRGEHEALFTAGTRFKVVARTDHPDGTTHVTMEEVAP